MQNFSLFTLVQEFGKELFAVLQPKEQSLYNTGINSLADAKNEIYYLLSFVLQKDKVFLLSHAEYVLSKTERELFMRSFERRKKGEPLAYITGQKEFYGSNFFVDSSTLIPRPDTEILVDEASAYFTVQKHNQSFYVMDLGTGTACILLSVLKECRQCFGYGIDINKKAIELAKRNADRLGLAKRSQFFTADFSNEAFIAQLEEILQGKQLDCIVSNPPYIPEYEYFALDDSVKQFEPKSALVSGQAQNGENGLAHAEKILQAGEELLKSGALLLIEHGYNQGKAMQALCSHYHYTSVKTLMDLGGNERALYAIKK